MSANYVDFDPELQALGYRAKTWDSRYFTIVAPDGENIGTTPFEDEIKGYAYNHHQQALEEVQSLKKPLIEIWAFEDASKELRGLSRHGGDEDYIVIIRDESLRGILSDLESNVFLDTYSWHMHMHNGEQIWIGAHA
jgi:hypothetical protein